MARYILALCFCAMSLFASAQINIKGIVTDESGEPLIGATVMAKGSNGTGTDMDGNYSIKADPKGELTVSYVGYETLKIKIAGRTEINVVLKENTAVLDEVVVVGYGVVKKSDLTSSISTVKGDRITEVTTGNAMDAL